MEIQRHVKYEEDLDPGFLAEIKELSGCHEIDECIQCGTCSSSCPMSVYMDVPPRKIIAMIKNGFRDEALQSFTIWLCPSCYTCQVRCPAKIKITDVMYALKRKAIEEKVYPQRFAIPVLDREMSRLIAKYGRNSELWLLLGLYLKIPPSGDHAEDGAPRAQADEDGTHVPPAGNDQEQGPAPVSRESGQGGSPMNRYAYYPGCSLKGNARPYEESILPVFREIGMPLEELDDWNCCGATAYFSVDDTMATAISGRNLSLAEQSDRDILAPCAGCYLTLRKSNEFLNGRSAKAAKILNDLKHVRVRIPRDRLRQAPARGPQERRRVRQDRLPRQAPSEGAEGRLLLRLPARPAVHGFRRSGLSDLSRRAHVGRRGAARRLRGQDPLLRRIAHRDDRGGRPALELHPPQGGQAQEGRLHRHDLPALPVQPRVRPGQDRPRPSRTTSGCPSSISARSSAWPWAIAKKDLGFSRSIVPLKPFWDKLGNGGAR